MKQPNKFAKKTNDQQKVVINKAEVEVQTEPPVEAQPSVSNVKIQGSSGEINAQLHVVSQIQNMDIASAVKNVASVLRAFSGTAEQHEILTASIIIIQNHCKLV